MFTIKMGLYGLQTVRSEWVYFKYTTKRADMANNYYINQSKCYTSVIFTKYCIGQSVQSSFSIKKLCNKSLAIKRRLRTLIGRTSFLGTGVFWTDLAALDPQSIFFPFVFQCVLRRPGNRKFFNFARVRTISFPTLLHAKGFLRSQRRQKDLKEVVLCV